MLCRLCALSLSFLQFMQLLPQARCLPLPRQNSFAIYVIAASSLFPSIAKTAEAPSALAVTGDNNMEDDLQTTLIAGGAILFVYLFVVPPIVLNWLRLRWYKRKFLETYLQFMFVFLFFPGLMLWAPFVNFRPFPRDPTMEYPWSTPKEDTPLYKPRKLTR